MSQSHNLKKIRSWYRGQIPAGRRSPLELVMIQATPFCNIDCKYCYLPNRDDTRRFDLDLLAPLFTKLESAALLPDDLTVLWHAGEPTVIPTEYYINAFAEIERLVGKSCRINHHMQTNATLLDDAYCQFIVDQNVHIGVSIDGPELLHNRFRTDRKGRGSFKQAMQGIENLRRYKIPFSVISVLTEFSLDYAHEIYDFMQSIGVRYLGFNIDEAEGGHESSSFEGLEVRDKYVRFMKTLHDRNKNSTAPIEIRELQTAFNAIAGEFHHQSMRCTENNPLSILSLDVDGNVSSFSPELIDNEDSSGRKFQFGNIKELEFEDIYDNSVFLNMNREIQSGIARCRETCRYFSVCGGGTPSNKLYENGSFDSTETSYCIYGVQVMVDVVSDLLNESQLSRLKGRNE